LLEYHQARVDRTFRFHFPDVKPMLLADVLPQIEECEKHKVRVVYGPILASISHQRYVQRTINSISLVEVEDYDYRFKYEDRGQIEKWREASGADEIIMMKDGLVTDASYANLALFDGKDWFTPAHCLLHGVMRQYLIDKGRLVARKIHQADVRQFKRISFINAMLGLDEQALTVSDATFISFADR